VLGERSDERANSRNGYRERLLSTTVGDLALRIPKLRKGTYFPDGIIERYSRSDRALVAAVAEMYVAGVSTRKVEKVAAEMGVESLSASQVSRLCAVLDDEVSAFTTRVFEGVEFPYLWLDATYVKCRSGGHVRSQALVTAIAVGDDGIRRLVGVACADTESYGSWKAFLEGLGARGVTGVRLVASDAHAGLVQAIEEVYQGASWQRCIVHLQRNVSSQMRTRADRAKALRPARGGVRRGRPASGGGAVPHSHGRDHEDGRAGREAAGGCRAGRAGIPRVPKGAP
jgi:transposase-like protein